MSFIPSSGIAGADFNVYAEGISSASVCSSLPQDEVERRMQERITGLSWGWTLASDDFRTGEPNPCPCDQLPETHSHYLFSC